MDTITLAAAKSYVDESLLGAGALKGEQGEPGKDAPKIVSVNVDESNVLSVKLSNGEVLEGGKIKTLPTDETLNYTIIQGIL